MELRVREVAKLFDVPEKRIYEWITEKALPARRVGARQRGHASARDGKSRIAASPESHYSSWRRKNAIR